MNNKKNGFTIIELLVVVSIMVVLGVIFTNILIDALRGRNKVKAINQVKQNGQVVLDNLSNDIRNADGIVCVDKYTASGANPGTALDTIVITNGGTYTQFRLFAPAPQINPTANGYIQKGTISADAVSLNNANPSNLCTQVEIFSSDYKQPLTDTDPVNGVSVNVTTGQNVFERRGDNILIKFNASAGVLAGYAYDVTVADSGIPFATSVQVRGGIR